MVRQDGPLQVQSDRSLLLQIAHPEFHSAMDALRLFAETIQTSDYMHIFKLSTLGLWNAAASGLTCEQVIRTLDQYSKYAIPAKLRADVRTEMNRYGKIRFAEKNGQLILTCVDEQVWNELMQIEELKQLFAQVEESGNRPVHLAGCIRIPLEWRGTLKQCLIKYGYPVKDEVGYSDGEKLDIMLKPEVVLRDYQKEAATAFYHHGSIYGGSGLILLPCGSGKTIVGLAVMALCGCETLILTMNTTSVQQWKREISTKTNIDAALIGEYSGRLKQVKPVTIATYQILTYRKQKHGEFKHMKLFQERNWGLIIYDEVHLLPAPVFRVTADLQAKRRLGLTATLVREDGKERDVYALVGPKVFEQPWRRMEEARWIAPVQCIEYAVPFSPRERPDPDPCSVRKKHRLACENPRKIEVVAALLKRHSGSPTLIIGEYLQQLRRLATELSAPLITGHTPHDVREEHYAAFREGRLRLLVLSKIANFAVDLPDAEVAIQVSGSYGSRQEESQRVGRILRPKRSGACAWFYSLVSADTREQADAVHRKMHMLEQGYVYEFRSIRELEEEGGGAR